MKKILSVVLTLTFIIFSINTIVYAYDSDKKEIGIFYAEEVKEAFEESINAIDYEQLENMKSSMLIYNEAIEKIGYDYLGGAYYDDTGKLHILVSDSSDLYRDSNPINTINSLIIETEVQEQVCIEYSKYSYNELMNFKSKIGEFFSENGIKAAGISDQLNKVIIYACEGTSLSMLQEIIPEDAFEVVQEEINLQDTASYTLPCGSSLYNSFKNSYASLGCGVVWDKSSSNPQYGYLTSGHFARVGDIISCDLANGWTIEVGTCVKSKNSGSVDAALINIGNSEVNSTSQAIDGSTYLFCGGVPAQGQPITAYGSGSNIMTGVVKLTSYDIGGSTDLVLTSAKAVQGDSGGAVIAPITTPELSITGIIKGKVTIGNNDLGMVHVKFDNIINEWDLNGLR